MLAAAGMKSGSLIQATKDSKEGCHCKNGGDEKRGKGRRGGGVDVGCNAWEGRTKGRGRTIREEGRAGSGKLADS